VQREKKALEGEEMRSKLPRIFGYSPRYRVMPNSPIRLERNRLISSAAVPALEPSHHLPRWNFDVYPHGDVTTHKPLVQATRPPRINY